MGLRRWRISLHSVFRSALPPTLLQAVRIRGILDLLELPVAGVLAAIGLAVPVGLLSLAAPVVALLLLVVALWA